MRRRGATWKIVSIWPADNWEAVYRVDEAPNEGDEFSSPLIGWAVVESKAGRQEIAGLDAGDTVQFADSWPNFVRYEHA